MTLPRVTYLSPDALDEGVGTSQVLAYVERLGQRGVDVRLHTFEKRPPDSGLRARLQDAGVTWTAHPFGRPGARAALGRVLTGRKAVAGAELVHARSDLAAASVLLARSPRWLWDVRSLFPDQRIALGTLRAGSPEERVLRLVERRAARAADAVVTLTEAVVPVLEGRHGAGVASRVTVVTTCVDTGRFALAPLPARPPLRVLLAGTVNRYYDVPAMVALVEALRAEAPCELRLLAPGPVAWERELASVGPIRDSVDPVEMPAEVAAAHVGLSVCREDAGVSLAAAMPTKIGEFLATGRPVVVNPSLGDIGRLVVEHRVGVTLAGASPDQARRATGELLALLDDPELPDRCRTLALQRFDLDTAVDRLIGVYQGMAAGAR